LELCDPIPKILDLKVDFMIELQLKLLRVKYKDVIEDEIEKIIKDIRWLLVNREDFTTNQQHIGF